MIPTTFRSLSFLVVATDEYVREVMTFALSAFGAEDVEEEANGTAAIDRLHQRIPDVLMSSLHTGNANGIYLTSMARYIESQTRSRTTVILLDEWPTYATVRSAIAAGADDFIRLPISAESLYRRLVRLLALKTMRPMSGFEKTRSVSDSVGFAKPLWRRVCRSDYPSCQQSYEVVDSIVTPEELRVLLGTN